MTLQELDITRISIDELYFDDLEVEVETTLEGNPIADGRNGGDDVRYEDDEDVSLTLTSYNLKLVDEDICDKVITYLNKKEEEITQEDIDNINAEDFETYLYKELRDRAEDELAEDFEINTDKYIKEYL